ncbi:MAG TPA: condensation domain-containing protein, partial [Pyrinomonadaceae bacterium]|nr:condensation domain-containing protein [Pyrinomonadaceae bacterium]
MVKQSKIGSAPVSFVQERLWFLDQINPGDVSANISRAIRIRGALNRDLLQQSLQALIRRHESLRTTFAINQLHAVKDSKPVQLVATNSWVGIQFIDLSLEPEVEIKARDLAKSSAQTPFDLTLGPLLRATLLRLNEREHVLLLSLHRIVCDDRSLEILTDELWAAYGAFVKEEPWAIATLQFQYEEYALWQRQLTEEETFQPSLGFWRAKVQGAPSVIELPTDRPRPPVQTWHGQSVLLELDNNLLEKLRSIASSQNATLATVLLAALRIVLARYSRQQDLIIGTVVANRDSSETKEVIGPLSNLLSLRSSVSGDLTFLELLRREQKIAVEAHANRFVPFEKLLDELTLERSLGHTPVFQVTFNLKEVPTDRTEVGGLQLERYEFDEDIVGYDLMVDAYEDPNRLVCRFRYSTDLFDRTTIERLTRHFENLLEGVVTNPTKKVSALLLLTESEQRQILVEWNNTERKFDQPRNVIELFERQAASTPSAVAVTFENQHLTYAELNARANQLARHLRSLGVRSETVVGICLERSLEMIIGLLGILKVGGAYLPLDPDLPKERLSFMIEDAGVRAVVTESRLSKELPLHQAKIVAVDEDQEDISLQSTENLDSAVIDESLAYVIYTSGSTGKPKGVQVPHSALANFLNSMREQPGISAPDALLSVTTLSFDIAGLEIYLPLTVGARLVVASRNETNDGEALARLISQCGATLMQGTPATWRLLIESGWKGEAKLRILCGGEALPKDLANQLLERGAELWNLYGPTETTIWSTLKQISAPVDEITIGKPIANTQIYILDQQ